MLWGGSYLKGSIHAAQARPRLYKMAVGAILSQRDTPRGMNRPKFPDFDFTLVYMMLINEEAEPQRLLEGFMVTANPYWTPQH